VRQGSSDAVQTCITTASATGGPCKALTDAYAAACPDETALISGCATIFKSLAVSCGAVDGGLDASNP
jgi:hypothetical protein